MSDHRLTIVERTLGFPSQRDGNVHRDEIISKLNFYHDNVNCKAMSAILVEVNWHQLMKDLSTENMYELVCKELLHVYERFVQVKNSKSKRKIIPRHRRILMRKTTHRITEAVMQT